MDRVFRPIGWERRPCPPPLSSRLPKRNAFQTRYVRSTFLAPFRKNFFLEASNYYCYYCYYYHGRKGKNIYIYIYNWNKGDARREGSVYLRGEFLLTAGVDGRTSERTNVSFIIIVSVKRLKEIEVRAHARTRGEIVGKSLSQIVAGLHR